MHCLVAVFAVATRAQEHRQSEVLSKINAFHKSNYYGQKNPVKHQVQFAAATADPKKS